MWMSEWVNIGLPVSELENNHKLQTSEQAGNSQCLPYFAQAPICTFSICFMWLDSPPQVSEKPVVNEAVEERDCFPLKYRNNYLKYLM